MRKLDKIALNKLRKLDPELSHALALMAMRLRLGPKAKPDSPLLKTHLAGLELPNPIGIAAGFDKNAQAIDALFRAGFGFVEIGAVTPLAQSGNPKPRLFRLSEDEAVINRFGFNNDGMEVIAERIARRRSKGVLGVNLGANKDSQNRMQDYQTVYSRLGPMVDFVTVNVSSPNTQNLRELQAQDALWHLIDGVKERQSKENIDCKIFLKIAPDLEEQEIQNIAKTALEFGLDAIIATNTTLAREGLHSPLSSEMGGLSGRPLSYLSTQVLQSLQNTLNGRVPLIGVGGIDGAQAANEKFEAGATAIQLYTSLIYKGFDVLDEIKSAIIQARS